MPGPANLAPRPVGPGLGDREGDREVAVERVVGRDQQIIPGSRRSAGPRRAARASPARRCPGPTARRPEAGVSRSRSRSGRDELGSTAATGPGVRRRTRSHSRGPPLRSRTRKPIRPSRRRKAWSAAWADPRSPRSNSSRTAPGARVRRARLLDRLERHRRQRVGSRGTADHRRTSPNSRQIGIRGTIPRRAYRPFEIGCTASVHMPQVWMPESSGSSGVGIAGPGRRHARPGSGPSAPADPVRLHRRVHEQHREEPQALA